MALRCCSPFVRSFLSALSGRARLVFPQKVIILCAAHGLPRPFYVHGFCRSLYVMDRLFELYNRSLSLRILLGGNVRLSENFSAYT